LDRAGGFTVVELGSPQDKYICSGGDENAGGDKGGDEKILSPPLKPLHCNLFGDRVAMVAINISLALNKIKRIAPYSRLEIELDRWEVNRDIN
jgi:hypothetical protein